MTEEQKKLLIKALLGLGIQALGKLIPFLGGFLGGPLGFLLTPVIGYLTGVLYEMLAKWQAHVGIDNQVEEDKAKTKAAQAELEKAQKNPETTDEQRKKAIADFVAAAARFGKLRVQ